MADINEFSYRDKYPRVNSIEMWEVGLPNGHRMIVKIRRSRILPKGKNIHYQARCTCKRWKSTEWHRREEVARKDYLGSHIKEVNKQGELL